MEILRNLFGSLTSGIIRLLVTVGVIAAVGYFLVKPALESTEKISHEFNTNIGRSFEAGGLNDIGGTIEDVNRKVEREIRRSFNTAKKKGGHDPDKLIRCIQRAHQNVNRIQRCTRRY